MRPSLAWAEVLPGPACGPPLNFTTHLCFLPSRLPLHSRGTAPPSNIWFLEPTQVHIPKASKSVQPFLHSWWQRVRILYNRSPFPLKIAPSHGGYGHPCHTRSLGPNWVTILNGISIGSAIFQGSWSWQTNWQTDHATPSVAVGHTLLVLQGGLTIDKIIPTTTRMWANAQRDGRPAQYRWRPLFNAAKFG